MGSATPAGRNPCQTSVNIYLAVEAVPLEKAEVPQDATNTAGPGLLLFRQWCQSCWSVAEVPLLCSQTQEAVCWVWVG